jgi:hypothetical protein
MDSILIKKTFFNDKARANISIDERNVPSSRSAKTLSLTKPQLLGIKTPMENEGNDGDGSGSGSRDCGTITEWYKRSCYTYNGETTCTDWEYTGSTYKAGTCTQSNPVNSPQIYSGYTTQGEDGFILLPFPGRVANNMNRDIIDSLRGYPCAQALIKGIKTNVRTDIATLIKNTFAKNDLVNITFSVDKYLAGTTIDGNERSGNFTRITGEFYIDLNPDVLTKSTQEYMLVTMYHEALQAFFSRRKQELNNDAEFQRLYEGVNVGGGRLLGVKDDAHIPLAYQNYVNGLKDVIMKFNTNFSEERAWALAKYGIIELLPAESKINGQERDVTKTGYTGTKCP